MRIQNISGRTRQLVFGLDVLCGLATVAAAVLLWRALRGHHRLLREHQSTLERRAAEMEAFASRVAHDIKGPLSAVSLSLDRAIRHATEEPLAGVIARGRRGVERVVVIIDGLLGFARAGARPEPGARAELGEVVADVLAAHRSDADAVACELATELPATAPIACSAGVLTSLLTNMVGNAIKYIGSGPARRVVVRAMDRGDAIRVEVQDTGPGIPAHLREAVFQPYVRVGDTSAAGIGLGLATVKRLVEGHGGRVGVDAALARGSIFWFELPKAPPAPVPVIARPESKPATT
jgi:signal transduction histidine kinase